VTPADFQIESTTCPACGYHLAVLFLDRGHQPLATLGWPESEAEARSMERLPLRFVRCVDCGHVFNSTFDYTRVPYTNKPNRMFNRGSGWSGFLDRLREDILDQLPRDPVVVEIGYGDASFLRSLRQANPHGRYIGFDPHGASADCAPGLELHRKMFVPEREFTSLRPHLIVSRHVLEHLSDPLGFVQRISFAAGVSGLRSELYLEVPCIDRALANFRVEDFYYEHNSHFTTESFSRMLRRGTTTIRSLGHGYNGEVVYAYLELKGSVAQVERAREAAGFLEASRTAADVIGMQLTSLYLSGKRVAIWGGTGKSAAFLHAFGLDAERFPLVVDSDTGKCGTYVPGTGQRIQPRDVLLSNPADVILIPPQWRAADIVAEMDSAGISYESVMIEHRGRLIDYRSGDHPYRKRSNPDVELHA
jgi:hypothetical protein